LDLLRDLDRAAGDDSAVGLTAKGLPVGIQIIGPYLEDATPIDLAGKLADVLGGFRPRRGIERHRSPGGLLRCAVPGQALMGRGTHREDMI